MYSIITLLHVSHNTEQTSGITSPTLATKKATQGSNRYTKTFTVIVSSALQIFIHKSLKPNSNPSLSNTSSSAIHQRDGII